MKVVEDWKELHKRTRMALFIKKVREGVRMTLTEAGIFEICICPGCMSKYHVGT